MSDASVAAELVAAHLSSFTYDWTTERELQDAMWPVLLTRFHALREPILSARDRPDFIVDPEDAAVAIEVKVKGSRNAILRQLGRYAEHGGVAAIVLASGRRTLLAGIPAEIHGKPVAVALVAPSL